MSKVNFKIGDFKAQKEFRKQHKKFIEYFPSLVNSLKIAFDRPYQANNLADAIIFDLSKECMDRFSEIGLLCANGQGDAAFILLRSMFEYLVCARYLHVHPEKSTAFVEYLHVHMHTVRSQMKRTYDTDRLPRSAEFDAMIDANFEMVKEKYSYKTPSGKRKTKSSWSDKGMVDMAMETGLGDYVILAYYLGIERAHPSILAVVNKQDPKEVVSQALMISHRTLLALLVLQHEHFGLEELKPIIGQHLREFEDTWKKYKMMQ